MIAGCSAGAFVGTGYALGRSIEDLEKISRVIPWTRMFPVTPTKTGLISTMYWEKLVEIYTKGKGFSDCRIPLYIQTTNLTKKKGEVFSKGDLQKILIASMSIPGICSPVKIGNDEYIDGGVTDPVPFQVLLDHGCDIVIAVDLTEKFLGQETDTIFQKTVEESVHDDIQELMMFMDQRRRLPRKLSVAFDNMSQRVTKWFISPYHLFNHQKKGPLRLFAIMNESFGIVQHELFQTRKMHAKNVIFIKPDFSAISKKDFWTTAAFIEEGEKAAQKSLPALQKAITLQQLALLSKRRP